MEFQHLFGLGESSWGSSTIFTGGFGERNPLPLPLQHDLTFELGD